MHVYKKIFLYWLRTDIKGQIIFIMREKGLKRFWLMRRRGRFQAVESFKIIYIVNFF